MNVDVTRVRAVARKEFREFRRNRFIVATMVVLPLIFLAIPPLNVFRLSASATTDVVHATVGSALLIMLLVPVICRQRSPPTRSSVSASKVPSSPC